MAKRELTEEQKKAAAERLKAAREKKAAEKEQEEAEEAPVKDENSAVVDALKAQNELLQKQMEELQRQILAMQKPQVIQVAADTERVHFLWLADVADYNLVTFGPGGMYGSITGKVGTFSVPKNDLSRILDNRNRAYLERRWLIVLDGLTDEEREAMGVDYKDGELLDRKDFTKLVSLGKDAICDIYPRLCASHKEMVARSYYEAWQNGNPAVTREKVIALRDITKDMGLDIAAFKQILREMNQSDEEE